MIVALDDDSAAPFSRTTASQLAARDSPTDLLGDVSVSSAVHSSVSEPPPRAVRQLRRAQQQRRLARPRIRRDSSERQARAHRVSVDVHPVDDAERVAPRVADLLRDAHCRERREGLVH